MANSLARIAQYGRRSNPRFSMLGRRQTYGRPEYSQLGRRYGPPVQSGGGAGGPGPVAPPPRQERIAPGGGPTLADGPGADPRFGGGSGIPAGVAPRGGTPGALDTSSIRDPTTRRMLGLAPLLPNPQEETLQRVRDAGITPPARTPVTAGSVNPDGSPGPTRTLAGGPGQVNPNYDITEARAQELATRFGGTVNTQGPGGGFGPSGTPTASLNGGYGPAGPISQPLRTLNIEGQRNYLPSYIPNQGVASGADDGALAMESAMPLGQIEFMMQRGDPEWLIRERLGLAPQTVGRW